MKGRFGEFTIAVDGEQIVSKKGISRSADDVLKEVKEKLGR